jgi:hypothetical protein
MKYSMAFLLAASVFLSGGVPALASDKDSKESKPAGKDKSEKTKEGKQTDPKKLMESLRESAKPKLDAKYKDAVKKLETDLKAVKAGAKATADQKKAIQESIVAAIQGAHKPNETTVKKLATSLSNGFAEGKLNAKEVLSVQEDVVAVLYATHVTADTVAALKADVTSIAETSSGAKADAKALAGDAEALARSAEEHAKKKK